MYSSEARPIFFKHSIIFEGCPLYSFKARPIFFKSSIIFEGCPLHSHFVRNKLVPLNYLIIKGELKLTHIILLWKLEPLLLNIISVRVLSGPKPYRWLWRSVLKLKDTAHGCGALRRPHKQLPPVNPNTFPTCLSKFLSPQPTLLKKTNWERIRWENWVRHIFFKKL